MATITLTQTTFGCTIGMGAFEGIGVAFSSLKQSTNNLTEALGSLKTKIGLASIGVNISESQEQTKAAQEREKTKKSSLSLAYDKLSTLISDVGSVDIKASSKIRERKETFYDRYYYLKPECEKTKKEKRQDKRAERWQNFKDFCGGVAEAIKNIVISSFEWCKEHWKLIATAVMVVVAITIIIGTGGTALGPVMAVVLAAAKGLLIGASVGGLCGGVFNVVKTGDVSFNTFLEGFEDGAFSGAISGAITGGMGAWMSGWASGGEQAALRSLSMGKKMLIGGIGDAGASVFGDLGDIFIKGEDMSIGEFAVNTVFSFALGFIATGVSNKVGQKLEIKIPGINSGQGSWAHVWGTQSTSSIRHQSIISLKSIFKGLGSDFVSGAWDYVFEMPKNTLGEVKDTVLGY